MVQEEDEPESIPYPVNGKIRRLRLLKNHATRQAATSSHMNASNSDFPAKLSLAVLTGSWDALKNEVCLWSVPPIDREGAASSLTEAHKISSINAGGDVVDLKVIEENGRPQPYIFWNNSAGEVRLATVKYDGKTQRLVPIRDTKVHSGKANSLAFHGGKEEISSGGDAGEVFMLDLDGLKTKKKFLAEPTAVECMTYTSRDTLLTATFLKRISVWDTRSDMRRPASVLSEPSSGSTFLRCMCQHPLQPDLFATGSEYGLISIWDQRKSNIPINSIKAYGSDVWELQFSTVNPDLLFSCSQQGLLLLWNFNGNTVGLEDRKGFVVDEKKIHVKDLVELPELGCSINSFDVDPQNHTVVSASDNGQIYVSNTMKTVL